jgi:hypothetical protein
MCKMLVKVVVLFALSAAVLGLQGARGEMLPSSGTFEGTYHRDRWGVGRFKYFVVDPDLHEVLAPFEGWPIRLVVNRAVQIGRGSSAILEIGEVTALDRSPLEVKVRTIPEAVTDAGPFQFVIELVNHSPQAIAVRNESVMLKVRHQPEVKGGDEPSALFKKYSHAQLSVKSVHSVQMYQSFVKTAARRYANLSRGVNIHISAGGSFPLAVLFEDGLSAGEYEIEVSGRCREDKTWHRPSMVWTNLEVGPQRKEEAERPGQLRLVRKAIKVGWVNYPFEFVVAPPEGEARQLVGFGNVEAEGWTGRVSALDAEGAAIPLEAHAVYATRHYPHAWQLFEIPEDGLRLRGTFRKASYFSQQSVARVVVDVLTERGVETFVLSEQFEDAAVPALPPFGTELDGVKLRARAARRTFRHDEPIRFYLQAVNVSGEPVVWWKPVNRISSSTAEAVGENIGIAIDGEPIELPERKAEYIGGWARKYPPGHVKEWRVILPESIDLGPGKHTFSYSITSGEGTYTNASGKLIPLLNGTLTSNTVKFMIE